MSRIEGLVSLWVGMAENLDVLEEYLTFYFTEDGDAIHPKFVKDFDTAKFDEDLREAEVIHPPTKLIREALRGFSYDDVVVPRFVQLVGETFDTTVDAVVLLYDFNYDGHIPSVSTPDVKLKFIGVVSYQ
ncbi:MAG: immunity 22 family protein [Aggregatilineales bacterium]